MFPKNRSGILVSLIFLIIISCVSTPTKNATKPAVILISLDGFRWDYLTKIHTTHLEFLKNNGASANKLIPVFPSSTFPNHYSIITGLYPEHHGIVANEMWDPKTEKHFTLDKASEEEWWEGEPLWNTLEKQGRITAPLFWVGSSAPIQKMRPHYWEPYKNTKYSERVQKILHWLDLPLEERPSFLTLYLEGVDTAGHHYGPKSKEVANAILDADKSIGDLISGLKSRNLFDKTNLIVVSDHGMTDVSPKNAIEIDVKNLRLAGGGAVLGIYSDDIAFLKKKFSKTKHLHVYEKSEIPSRFHYQNHRRIPPLLLIAEQGWYLRRDVKDALPKGAHGYDNQNDSMKGIFIAHGPSFRKTRLETLENIHIYELTCHLLGAQPAKNDGSLSETKALLMQ